MSFSRTCVKNCIAEIIKVWLGHNVLEYVTLEKEEIKEECNKMAEEILLSLLRGYGERCIVVKEIEE